MFLSLSITAGLYFSTFSQILFCSLCGKAFPADRLSMEPQRSRCATVAATSSQLTRASAASGNVPNECWTDLLFAIMYFPREGRCISSRCGGQPELAILLWIEGLGAHFGQGHASAALARFGEFFLWKLSCVMRANTPAQHR